MKKVVLFPSILRYLLSEQTEDKMRLLLAFPDLPEIFILSETMVFPITEGSEIEYEGITKYFDDEVFETEDVSNLDEINIRDHASKLEKAFLGDANAITLKIVQYPAVYQRWLKKHGIQIGNANNWNSKGYFGSLYIPTDTSIRNIESFDFKACADLLCDDPPRESMLPVNLLPVALSLAVGKVIMPTIYNRLYYNVFSSLFNFGIYDVISRSESLITARFYKLNDWAKQIRYPHFFTIVVNNLECKTSLLNQLFKLRSDFGFLRQRLLGLDTNIYFQNSQIEIAKLQKQIDEAVRMSIENPEDSGVVKKIVLGGVEGLGQLLEEGKIFPLIFKTLSPLLGPVSSFFKKIEKGHILNLAQLVSVCFDVRFPRTHSQFENIILKDTLLNAKCAELYEGNYRRFIGKPPRGFEVGYNSETNQWIKFEPKKPSKGVFTYLNRTVNSLLAQ